MTPSSPPPASARVSYGACSQRRSTTSRCSSHACRESARTGALAARARPRKRSDSGEAVKTRSVPAERCLAVLLDGELVRLFRVDDGDVEELPSTHLSETRDSSK